MFVRGEFGQVACAAAVFATGRKALQTTQKQQQQRCGNADGFIARHQADRERGSRHQQDDQREDPLAPDSVTEWPEEESAERPHEECGREDCERTEQGGSFVAGGKELRGDVGRQGAVDGEVVPLDGVADRGAAHRFPDRRRVGGAVAVGCVMDGHDPSS